MTTQKDVIQRIIKIIQFKNMSALKFSDVIGFSYSTLNNYITGRRKAIDLELIIKILLSFDDISAEWIILRIGQMTKSISEKSENNSPNDYIHLIDKIVELSGRCALLEDKLSYYEKGKHINIAAERNPEYGK